MTKQELKDKFLDLYYMIIDSDDEQKMMMLGSVTRQMMEWMIENKQEAAEEWIERLCAVKWHNYVTHKEALAITEKMDPKPLWAYQQWETAMKAKELPMESEPCYNKCALFTTMSMISSDSSETIAKLSGFKGDELFMPVYWLALDKLKDKDGKFNIRKYFELI